MFSIIIVNWNNKELLVKCLKSIYQSSFRHFEIIVVDNASGDGSLKLVKEKFPDVILKENNKNLGFAAANNIGISRSKGDLFLFLNSDTVVRKETLEKIEEKMQDRSIGLLGVKLIYPDGRFQQEFYRKFPTILQTIFFYLPPLNRLTLKLGFLRRKFFSALDGKKSGWLEDANIPGACLAIRREVMEKIGLWDDDFWFWMEDVDLCQRALQAGFKQYFLAEAEVLHFGGASYALWDNFEKFYNFRKSYLRYFKKHKKYWEYVLVRWLFLINGFSLVILFLPFAIFSKKYRARLKDFFKFLYAF